MMTLPAHYGVAIFTFFFGINGIWLAHRLFWPQRPQYFWFTAGGIMLTIGCLIVTGAAESIARWLWPLALDPAIAPKFQQQAACDKPRQLGFMFIMAPVVLILVPVWLLKDATPAVEQESPGDASSRRVYQRALRFAFAGEACALCLPRGRAESSEPLYKGQVMIPAKIAGVVILGVPLLLAAWVLLRRQPRPVLWFAIALILVGLGYLMATGATDDIARSIVPAPVLQPAG